MPKDKVLIFTSVDDTHCDYVIQRANAVGLGQHFIRFHTEEFLTNFDVNFDGSNFAIHVKDSGRRFDSDDILSVWYRRPREIKSVHDEDAGINSFRLEQASACLRGLYFCTHDSARWVNPLPAIHRSRIKLQQLQLANRLGLSTPQTVVTNVPEIALTFVARVGDVCVKSLDNPWYKVSDRLHPFFTHVLSRDDLRGHVQSVRQCPVLLQQFIKKDYDIRVIVMGDELFAFEIDSQSSPLSEVDFRGLSPSRMVHRSHQLPSELCDKMMRFVRSQGLLYSAVDLVHTKAGEYYFLENNPNGQWLWLELMTGVPLTDTLIALLMHSN